MKVPKIDSKALDSILDNMLETVNYSKSEIYEIGERCQQDFDQIISELETVKSMVLKVIADGDELERKARESRKRLSFVSSRFKEFTEEQVRDARWRARSCELRGAAARCGGWL